jgi:hypothetical protein
MVCAHSLHNFHALIFSGMFAPFPSHARIWDRRGASIRALGHRYLAGRNQGICLVSIVQHELLLTWHGGWGSVFCWPMAAGVCDGRTTTVQSTATNEDDTLCNPSQHEIKSQVIHRTWQHHSPHDHSPTSRLRCKAMHHPFWPFIPTHMCTFVPLLISVRCGALRFQLFIAGQRNGFAKSAQECGRNQQTPTPRAASRISRCNHRNLYLNHPNTLLITAFRWISTRSILKANLLD